MLISCSAPSPLGNDTAKAFADEDRLADRQDVPPAIDNRSSFKTIVSTA